MVHTMAFSSLHEPFWKQANNALPKEVPEKPSYFKMVRASDITEASAML